MNTRPSISVIGLGYVGLPLAVQLAKHFDVTGFDIDEKRIQELKKGYDRTEEVASPDLRSSTIHLTASAAEIAGHNVHIITVPTPVGKNNQPDLEPVRLASETVGQYLKKGDIVVYESTVYPGVTEDFCGPILERCSGLVCGQDFFLGYSPERINPGDREHTVDRITKVVSGQTEAVSQTLAELYGAMNNGNIFVAKNIKTAEAAKVIENAQRDINIAFVNEIATIFQKVGISVYDVLEAAGTKWNFLNFQPGLVGGHCIGVDPYYLAHCAQTMGYEPQVILSGRAINEAMSHTVSSAIDQALKVRQPSLKSPKTLVLGLTFKEDVPDLRNTKVIDVIKELQELGHDVEVHDPQAYPEEAAKFYGIDLKPTLDSEELYDCVIGAVPHKSYLEMGESSFQQILKPSGLVADLKGMWRHSDIGDHFSYWCL